MLHIEYCSSCSVIAEVVLTAKHIKHRVAQFIGVVNKYWTFKAKAKDQGLDCQG